MRDLAIVPQRLPFTLYGFRRGANKPIIQVWMMHQVLEDPNFTPRWAPLFGRARGPMDGIDSQIEKKVRVPTTLACNSYGPINDFDPSMTALKS